MEGLDRIYNKNENFVFRKIEDETILVPIKDNVGDMGSIYNLNEVAAFVWEQLDGKKSLRDIKHRLSEEYEVSAKEAGDDLSAYIAQLKEDVMIHKNHIMSGTEIDLLAYWRFNLGSGIIAGDCAKDGDHHGTIFGEPSWVDDVELAVTTCCPNICARYASTTLDASPSSLTPPSASHIAREQRFRTELAS